MLGTIMVANVFFVIIPAHWELIRAKQAGREPDPAAGARGKQRSVHNNYFTLPVLFAMITNHFAFTYTHAHAWLVLVCADGVGARDPPLLQPAPPGTQRLGDPGASLRSRSRRSRSGSGRPTTSPAGRQVPFARVRGDRRRALRRRAIPSTDAAGLLGAAAGHRARHARADRGAGVRRSSSRRSC